MSPGAHEREVWSEFANKAASRKVKASCSRLLRSQPPKNSIAESGELFSAAHRSSLVTSINAYVASSPTAPGSDRLFQIARIPGPAPLAPPAQRLELEFAKRALEQALKRTYVPAPVPGASWGRTLSRLGPLALGFMASMFFTSGGERNLAVLMGKLPDYVSADDINTAAQAATSAGWNADSRPAGLNTSDKLGQFIVGAAELGKLYQAGKIDLAVLATGLTRLQANIIAGRPPTQGVFDAPERKAPSKTTTPHQKTIPQVQPKQATRKVNSTPQPVPRVPVLPSVDPARNVPTVSPIPGPPELPDFPKEFDYTPSALVKLLRKAGSRMLQQRVDDYLNRRTTRAEATEGLQGKTKERMNRWLDAIDRSRLPPGGARGGRSSTVSATGSTENSNATRAARRTKSERQRAIGQRILKARFDGKNVSARFISTIQRAGDHSTTAATPAKDSDRLTSGSPATVGDVKKMLGGLNNSIISIKKLPMGLVVVTAESKGFRAISVMLRTSSKGIDEITVGEISTGGSRTPQRNAATNEVMPNLDTRQPLVGALLALKICQYAEQNNISGVLALAAVGPANSESGDLATQGARVWPTVGLDGPIGEVNVMRVQKFLRNNPAVAEKAGLRSVTGKTRVLDLVADPTGKLIPEAMEFWRTSPNSYDGRVDLSNKSSRSYLIYQRALEDYGLK
jgi:hypothetical protein